MKILFITLTNIGDVVISTILLDRLLKEYPYATVDVVAGHRTTSLFEGMENLGRLIPLIKQKRHGHYIDIWKTLRHEEYDIIVDLRTPLLGRLLNGKKKIIFKPNMKERKALQMAKLWKWQKGESEALSSRVFVSDAARAKVEMALTDDRKLVTIAPTANWIAKQWPQLRFAELVKRISEMPGYENARFAILGAEHERLSVSDLIDYISPEKRIDLVGKTSLCESAVWIEKSSLFVGNDSGLAHIAAAVKTPMVTIFGPTRDDIYAPSTEKGITVVAPKRKDVNLEKVAPKRLITDVTVDMVEQAVCDILNIQSKMEEGRKYAS